MWSFIVLFFFFFKQKTAYEMRISDWSSDVCSSDLQETYPETAMRVPGNVLYNGYMATRELLRAIERTGSTNNIAIIKALEEIGRASCRERVCHTGRSRWSPSHSKKKTMNNNRC